METGRRCRSRSAGQRLVQTIPHRNHTRALFLVAGVTFHSCTLRMAQGMMSLCESSQKSILHRSCRCWVFLRLHSLLCFLIFHLTDSTIDLSSAINWNQSKPCATPLGDELSRRLAGPIPSTRLVGSRTGADGSTSTRETTFATTRNRGMWHWNYERLTEAPIGLVAAVPSIEALKLMISKGVTMTMTMTHSEKSDIRQ